MTAHDEGADPSPCRHLHLLLLRPSTETRLRCRHCHLTIAEAELGGAPCPECLEATGRRRRDFETIEVTSNEKTRVRCEGCGLLFDVG